MTPIEIYVSPEIKQAERDCAGDVFVGISAFVLLIVVLIWSAP